MKNKPAIIGISLGVLYGLIVRVLIELFENDWVNLMTLTFIFLTPILIGAITVKYGTLEEQKSWRFAVFKPWLTIGGFMIVTLITYLEAIICVVMLLPAFLLSASIGGLITWFISKEFPEKENKIKFLIFLPVIICPIEAQVDNATERHQVTTEIIINSANSNIWTNIKSVDTIGKDELVWSFSHFIGIPTPINSNLDEEKIGGVRNINWEEGIKFKETIIEWEENKSFSYKIEIDTIPPDAFDKHIQIGGKYLKIYSGGYNLERIDSSKTKVILYTDYEISSKFNFYCKFWADWILDDFQTVILNIIKSRCENESLPVTAHIPEPRFQW